MNTNNGKKRLFVTEDGKNVVVTFALVSSLFLLWGFCNGMIDVMDKHFQEELHLTLAQSANVQWAHYLGYFLMSLPAGWLASKLGYKGGIMAGLMMVAAGGLWFIPATQIAEFWAFLVGVCFIASGLTFLETMANPYTTVLGDPHYAAARINLAQSANGVGWILGPMWGLVFLFQGRRWTKHGQPDALDSLRGHCRRGYDIDDYFLFCRGSGHQIEGRLSSGRRRAGVFQIDLVAPSFRIRHSAPNFSMSRRRRAFSVS